MGKKPLRRTPFRLILVIAGIILFMQVSTFLFAPSPEKDAWGKIIFPENHTRITSKITVAGETQDIAKGHYIWLALSPGNQNSCLPQKRVLRNTRFRTVFDAGDVKTKTSLSIYILDEKMHKIWTKWLENKTDKGVHCPERAFRLDAIQLAP